MKARLGIWLLVACCTAGCLGKGSVAGDAGSAGSVGANQGGSTAGSGQGGGPSSPGGGPALGGASSSGGSVSTSGGAFAGGSPAGGTSVASGGVSPTGGVKGTGGLPSASGGSASGGTPTTGGSATGGVPTRSKTAAAEELCAAVNAYRQANGAAAIPLSSALFETARLHLQDLAAHPEFETNGCGLRSWSAGSTQWTECCYRDDNPNAACMWSKPQEITASRSAGRYSGNGFETISAYSAYGVGEKVVDLWVGNTGTADLLLNRGTTWSDTRYNPWRALGCAFSDGYATAWVGDQTDSVPYSGG